MTIAEVYSNISAHQIKGLMIHSQMADYYRFLGLPEYAKCHEHHYKKESCNWRKLSRYYIEHHNKLIEEMPIDNPKTIPQTWYQYTRQAVDVNTKKKAIRTGLNMWHDWESDTKIMYERYISDLIDNGHIADAMFVKRFLHDVDKELTKVEAYLLNKESAEYDMPLIISEQ